MSSDQPQALPSAAVDVTALTRPTAIVLLQACPQREGGKVCASWHRTCIYTCVIGCVCALLTYRQTPARPVGVTVAKLATHKLEGAVAGCVSAAYWNARYVLTAALYGGHSTVSTTLATHQDKRGARACVICLSATVRSGSARRLMAQSERKLKAVRGVNAILPVFRSYCVLCP